MADDQGYARAILDVVLAFRPIYVLPDQIGSRRIEIPYTIANRLCEWLQSDKQPKPDLMLLRRAD